MRSSLAHKNPLFNVGAAAGNASTINISPETPVPVTPAEVVAMNEKLAGCQRALDQVMDAMMAIRFGLLLAGYPVDLKDALKHPLIKKHFDDVREKERSEMMFAQFERNPVRINIGANETAGGAWPHGGGAAALGGDAVGSAGSASGSLLLDEEAFKAALVKLRKDGGY